MGQQSAEAQGLRQLLTSYPKLQVADTRLYIAAQRDASQVVYVVGILKMGSKNLFVRAQNAQFKELQPLCCLDFYVHYSCQRCGIGKQLFESMLAAEQAPPRKIAYDRPSPKLLGFLSKHYCLKAFTPQENNFVVYHKFFEGESPDGATRRRGDPATVRALPVLLQVSNSAPVRGSSTQQHRSYDCNGRRLDCGAGSGPKQPHQHSSRSRDRADTKQSTSRDPSSARQSSCSPIDQNLPEQSSPVRGGLRGLQGMKRTGNTEARAKIPVLPQRAESGPQSSRTRSVLTSHVSSNFLHHQAPQDLTSNRDNYQAAYHQRKASWWG